MMEWLRAILEKAEIKDGVLNIDEIMSTVNKEAPKNVMSKQEYNNVNEQLKTANSTIDDLKKNNKDNSELQEKITEHEETIKRMEKEHKEEIASMKKISAAKDDLRKSKAKHEDLLLKMYDLSKITINDDGTIVGLEEQTKQFMKDYADMFEEKKDNTTTQFKGLQTHNPAGKDKPSNAPSQGASFAKELNSESSKSTESKFFN